MKTAFVESIVRKGMVINMKKIMLLVIVTVVSLLSLTSCSAELQNSENTITSTTDTVWNDSREKTDVGVSDFEEPPPEGVYGYNSWEEMIKATESRAKDGDEIAKKFLEDLKKLAAIYGSSTEKQEVSSSKTSASDKIISLLSGEPIPYANREGFSSIIELDKELYGLPWKWYKYSVSGTDLDIKVSVLTEIEGVAIPTTTTFLNILNQIAPEAPNPSNYSLFSSYESIYEEQILLSSGTTVTALVSELRDSSNIYVKFYYKGLLVSVYAPETLLTDTFWNSFDIVFE